MDIMEKLTILADSAKYDAACTSSGSNRPGHTLPAGCCQWPQTATMNAREEPRFYNIKSEIIK